jgi:nitrite reductase (NO-forming)
MKNSFLFFVLVSILSAVVHAGDLPVENAVLTDAPFVPPVITRDHPSKVLVELEVIEKIGKLADGVEYTFWTFGGSVPGKFIRIRQGDTVEFTLINNGKNKLPHNIDMHAVNGPGGGAGATATAPGHKSTFSFKALNPGLFVYHCATAPVGMHIANGMYGMIYVQPVVALPKVDHEFYVFQSDFYTKGKNGDKGLQLFSQEKAIDEKPTYVVFNGSQGALVGDKALKAKVGDTVRLFFGNGGPNLVSSFHIIGEIFDKVYTEGGSTPQENVQTTLVPSGGATMVEFKLNTPGTYLLVDHSIFRAFNKGALGMLKVEGEPDNVIFSTSSKSTEEGTKIEKVEKVEQEVKVAPETKVEVLKSEVVHVSPKDLFIANCSACHGEDGKGQEGVFPPLAKSDFLKRLSNLKDRKELISIPLLGKKGKFIVNKKEYDGEMPNFPDITDKELSEVLTYVSNHWGNKARAITENEVKRVRTLVIPSKEK